MDQPRCDARARPRPGRSRGAQGPPAGRLVVRRLCRRRHHAADRRRGSCARRSTSAPGQKVLDVAAGNGNVSLAAARRWCDVIATDYVPALLERGRERAAAERLDIDVPRGRRGGAAVRRTRASTSCVSTFGVMFTPDQDRAAAELLRVCKPRRQDRPRQLDAGGLHRPAVQDHRQARAAAGRRQSRRRCGARGRGSTSCSARTAAAIDGGATPLRVPLPLAGALAGRSSRPTTGRCSRPSPRSTRPAAGAGRAI